MSDTSPFVIIEPKVSDLGDGFKVGRLLPQVNKRSIGPFVFWDHMGPVTLNPEREMKVRAHPHIGLSTLTYLFSGEIFHRDSLKTEQKILPGEINWMTAGKWIAHSERSRPDSPMTLEGIQVWVALPKEKEDIDPSFHHFKPEELPTLSLGDLTCTLIAGDFEGKTSPVPTHSPMFYLNAKGEEGLSFKAQLPKDQEGAIYIVQGELNDGKNSYSAGKMIAFQPGTQLKFKLNKESHFMFFGGQAFAERRHVEWNFVSHDPKKIEQAKKKWLSGEYEPVINEDEFIPLPDERSSR